MTGGQTNGRAAEPGSSTTLTQFLKLVLARPSVELVDLGPAVGSNIAFFGERICCKIHVADLYADLDHHAGQDALDRLAEFLERRFGFPDESVDAVLGWDIFDFLDPEAATVLAGEVKRILRRGGTVLAIFSGGGSDEHGYVKYVIESEATLRRRVYQGACRRGRVLQNREINELFAGLELVSSVLLKSGAREVLFRKPVSV